MHWKQQTNSQLYTSIGKNQNNVTDSCLIFGKRLTLEPVINLNQSFFITLLLIPFILFVFAAPSRSGPAASIVLKNVTLIDGTGAAAMPGAAILISEGRIAAINPAELPADSKVIDGAGKYVIPGLWDMHAHLTTHKDVGARVLLAYGVTGIRDVGGDLSQIDWIRSQIEEGKLDGPSIYRAGPFVDGSKPGVPDRLVVWNAEDARAAVRFLKQRNVDFIKTHTATPAEAFFALIDEARKQNLTVAGHIPMSVDPFQAVEAGQHSIEHVVTLFEGPFTKLVRGGKSQEAAMAEFTDEYFVKLARMMAAKKSWFDPTLIAYWNRSFQWDIREKKLLDERYITASAKEFWKQFPDLPDDRRELLAKAYERFRQIAGIMNREGVRFLVGTDLGAKYTIPGIAVHDELKHLVEDAGLTAMQAIQAGTKNCAESLGILKDTGTIEAGKLADLVLIDADPLSDITNTRKISAVIRKGKYYSRTDLDLLLKQAAEDAPSR